MSVVSNLERFNDQLKATNCRLVAVSKTKPCSAIMEAYNTGFRRFGENRVQELQDKYQELPKDIEWHMIGHLQTNKVKAIAPFVHMIHAVDSLRLAAEINKQATKHQRTIKCLLQIHIAREASKFGFDKEEIIPMIKQGDFESFDHLDIVGLMGMATFSHDQQMVRDEFRTLKNLFTQITTMSTPSNFNFKELSMGMSNDYQIAIEEGSTMIRIGSDIFGARN